MSRESGTITLIRTSTGWSARFAGEAAEEVNRLFKTNTIPASFTREATADQVKKQIKAGWPRCIVRVEEAQ